jgi:riboflavin synthase
MFTGIITDIGLVRAIKPGTDTRLEIDTAFDMDGVDIGASIACSGPCLTVIEKGTLNGQNWFAVEASAETLKCTTIGTWAVGRPLNLERALCFGDELGGHMVSGHVDGIARIMTRDGASDADGVEAGSQIFTVIAPDGLGRFIAAKGSVALDGVSLTVNEVADIPGGETRFTVNVIPHTLAHTTFGDAGEGTELNFEVDPIARYVERLG